MGDSVTCPNGHANGDKQRYCTQCGLALWVTCSNGHTVASVVGECPTCGIAVPVPDSPAVLGSAPPVEGGAPAVRSPSFEPLGQPGGSTGPAQPDPHQFDATQFVPAPPTAPAAAQPSVPVPPPAGSARAAQPRAPMNPQQQPVRMAVPRVPTTSRRMRRRIVVGVLAVAAMLVLFGACQALLDLVSAAPVTP